MYNFLHVFFLVSVGFFYNISTWNALGQSEKGFSNFLVAGEKIKKILICEEKSPFDSPYLQSLDVVITNRNDITRLYNSLNNTTFTNRCDAPFVGIFCHQVFIGTNDEVLAISHIVNYDATVVLNNGIKKDQHYYILDKGPTFDGIMVCQSIDFCRIIYDRVNENIPAFITKQNKFYIDVEKKTVEKMIFQKLAPTNGLTRILKNSTNE